MSKIIHKILSPFENLFRNLTIHQRVALLISSDLVALGLVLVLFINLIAPLLITVEVGVPDTVVLVDTVDPLGTPITILLETPAPTGYTISKVSNFSNGDPLYAIRLLSFIGLVIIVGIGFLASRWLAHISLQPMSIISKKANHIDAISLDQRLNYQGPQDEVKVLADSFDAMLDRLDTNFERQGQFIGNLAHELRTPLSSLRMNIEALNLDAEASLEDYHKLAETAERSLSRLEQLVEDILLLAKGENEIAHQSIVMGAVIDEILEELSPLAQEHKISLKLGGEIEVEIMGDEVLLQIAISNLVKNGILYNHPGGIVETVIRREEKYAIIEVDDNGIGISNHDQEKIFERFYRANQSSENTIQGKGLGLAIVKHIIELHHGKIDVESELGVGSTFRVFLPSLETPKAGLYI